VTERQIIFHKHYFQEFYIGLDDKTKEKFRYVFRLIRTVEKVPEKFLKHLEGADGVYEIRIEVGSNIYRVFCCFDRGNIIVLFNAFQKKSQKTPAQEITLAEKLKTEYFILKDKQDGKERGNTKR
jgi:phage-related protein